MTTRTRNLIRRIIHTARIIAAAVECCDPLRAAEELLRAWQLETMLAAEAKKLKKKAVLEEVEA